jgi:hypothetical protein
MVCLCPEEILLSKGPMLQRTIDKAFGETPCRQLVTQAEQGRTKHEEELNF